MATVTPEGLPHVTPRLRGNRLEFLAGLMPLIPMANSAFFQRPEADIVQAVYRLKELDREIAQAYQRWENLEQQ